jgi:hypothetical protein
MFKGLSNFAKSKNGMWVFIVVVVLFVIWALMSYSNTKSVVSDSMSNYGPAAPVVGSSVNPVPNGKPNTASGAAPIMQSQPQTTPDQLLPLDKNSEWNNINGMPNPSQPYLPDLMKSGVFIGLDTIGQTLRNANQQLRSDPVIQKQNVSPWMMSTIEPDLARVPLEIGCSA